MYQCAYCRKSSTTGSGMRKHRTAKHPQWQVDREQGKFRLSITCQNPTIKCGICGSIFGTLATLCAHMREVHEKRAEIINYKFENLLDFEQWKEEHEAKSKDEFRKMGRANPLSRKRKYEHYICHRSGSYNSISRGKRALKAVPTKKLGFHCTAFMKIQTDAETGNVYMNGCLDHYGHEAMVSLMRIRKWAMAKIAEMAIDKYEIREIIEQFKTYNEEEIGREQTLTTKDIHNIINNFGLNKNYKPRARPYCPVCKLDFSSSLTDLRNHLSVHRKSETPIEPTIIVRQPMTEHDYAAQSKGKIKKSKNIQSPQQNVVDVVKEEKTDIVSTNDVQLKVIAPPRPKRINTNARSLYINKLQRTTKFHSKGMNDANRSVVNRLRALHDQSQKFNDASRSLFTELRVINGRSKSFDRLSAVKQTLPVTKNYVTVSTSITNILPLTDIDKSPFAIERIKEEPVDNYEEEIN